MEEKNLDFDLILNRKNTNSLKYDFARRRGYPEDILPMWVADMDFKTSSFVQEAIDKVNRLGVYGYTETAEHYYEIIKKWMYEQYGWFSNVDFTSDRDKIRWSAFLKDNRYADRVGIYEGGALYSKGVWRPTKNSIMNENMGDFNAPSRWAIYQRIMKLSGEECSFEKFLEYDAVNRSASAAASKQSMKGAANRMIEHSAPPVVVP